MFGQILKNMSWVMRHLEKSVGSCGYSETICFFEKNSCIFKIIIIYEKQILYQNKSVIFRGKKLLQCRPQKNGTSQCNFWRFFLNRKTPALLATSALLMKSH